MGNARNDHVPQMMDPPPSTAAVQAPLKAAASIAADERKVLYSPRSRRFGSGRSSRKRYSSWGYGLYWRLSASMLPLASSGLARASSSGFAMSAPCSRTTTLKPALARSQLIVPPPPLLPTTRKSAISMEFHLPTFYMPAIDSKFLTAFSVSLDVYSLPGCRYSPNSIDTARRHGSGREVRIPNMA